MIKVIEIAKLDRNCGTQLRELREAKVGEYSELMQDGVEFPPVQAVQDGEQYILWDGFHRVHAAIDAGSKEIYVEVSKGNIRSAIWLAMSANRLHGIPVEPEERARMVEICLSDPIWRQKSLRAIAEHIGCSHETVRQIKIKLDTPEVEEETKTKEMPEHENSGLSIVDSEGNEVPRKMEEVFNMRGTLDSMHTLTNDLRQMLTGIENKEGSECVNFKAIINHVRSIKRLLKDAKPYSMCPICEGFNPDCSTCEGRGWLNESMYKLAIRKKGE